MAKTGGIHTGDNPAGGATTTTRARTMKTDKISLRRRGSGKRGSCKAAGPLAKSFVRPPGQSWTGNFEEVLAMHGTAMRFLPLTRLIQI